MSTLATVVAFSLLAVPEHAPGQTDSVPESLVSKPAFAEARTTST
jgi:hypothetical protein